MMKLFVLLVFCCAQYLYSQNIFRIAVKDSASHEPLIGVNAFIKSLNKGAASDLNGNIEIQNIPDYENDYHHILLSIQGNTNTVMLFINGQKVNLLGNIDARKDYNYKSKL